MQEEELLYSSKIGTEVGDGPAPRVVVQAGGLWAAPRACPINKMNSSAGPTTARMIAQKGLMGATLPGLQSNTRRLQRYIAGI